MANKLPLYKYKITYEIIVIECISLGNDLIKSSTSGLIIALYLISSYKSSNSVLVGNSFVKSNHNKPSGNGSSPSSPYESSAFGKNSDNSGIE